MSASEGPWYLKPRAFRPRDLAVMRYSASAAFIGVVLAFGWSLVRFPRFSSTQPAPLWLAWLAAVMTAGGAATFLVTLARADVAITEEGPSSTRKAERANHAVLPLAAATAVLVVVSLVSTESSARWDPAIFAVVMAVVLIGMKLSGFLQEP